MKKSFEYGKILKEAGFTSQQVQSQICVLTDLTETNMATKSDIKDLKQSIIGVRLELKSDVNNLRTELKTEINNLRVELKTEINDLRVELKTEINELKNAINKLKIQVAEIIHKSNGLEDRITDKIYKKMVTTNIALFTLFFSLFKFLNI